ncbi:N-acyl-D-amino-acid deacylase family protein [Polyangium aurulentum]|uniref:N-acyl-D-amino-acid deacylase family protein n=1 Tax=Polyangium aurulentum TaxID=2567896 RepID=UPI0010AE5B84|nr:amidohydrolase family protein [Polyangium aurulentum]UQA56075.1 amidohydrolase family protein [Polyangium aurulentum]
MRERALPGHFAVVLVGALATACAKAPPPASSSAPASTSAPASASAGAPTPAPVAAAAPISAPAPAPAPPFHSDEVFRLFIRGGEVIDGSGSARRRADVLVRADRIAFVGEVDPSVRAERVIDATGAVVTPGFIDAHSHLPPTGDVELALAQGVTTIVVGQDGLSPAEHIGPWLAKIDASRPRVNVATLVGHATVRNRAGIGGRKDARPAEIDRMRALVEEAMKEGAFGLSTGLEYDPGRLAPMAELVAAAEPVGARGGVVMSHLRSEDDDRIDASIDELLEQCAKSRARAHVAHLKVVLGHGEARAEAILKRFDEARRKGLEVTADLYPYAASYTTIGILFPDFARPPASYAQAKQKRLPDLKAHLRARVTQRNGPEATLFGTGAWAGKTLAQAARARNVPFEDLLVELGPNGAEAAYFVMDEALVARLFKDPFVMVGTDGGGGGRHPRGYGAFARVVEEYVKNQTLVSLEEAVRKMSALPASTLRLEGDRGCLRAGCAADLLVFTPSKIRARADWGAPHRLAEGMQLVVVGGVIEREGGKITAGRGGRALRSSATTPTPRAP